LGDINNPIKNDKVDPRAYAAQAHASAAQGFLVVIVPVPLHLAVLAPDVLAA
jgi:hypothetical protein